MREFPESLRSKRQRVGRWLLNIHRLRVTEFRQRLSEEAARALSPSGYQEILLDLYLAGLEERDTYQSCLATTEPPATVHRQTARLEKLGAVSRSTDLGDRRRLNVVLTPDMQEAFDAFIDAVEASICRQFSAES